MAMKLRACSACSIATPLGRSPSTISRELPRKGYSVEAEQCDMGLPRVADGYEANRAGIRARRVRRAAWPVRRRHREGALWAEVGHLLTLKLSAQQIAAKLKQRYRSRPNCKPPTRPVTPRYTQ